MIKDLHLCICRYIFSTPIAEKLNICNAFIYMYICMYTLMSIFTYKFLYRSIRRTLLSTPIAEELKVYLRTRGPPPPELLNLNQIDNNINYNDNNDNNNNHNIPLSQDDNELYYNCKFLIRDCTGNVLDFSNKKIHPKNFHIIYDTIKESHVFNTLNNLNLSGNKLVFIPKELKNLLKISKLNFSGNLLGGDDRGIYIYIYIYVYSCIYMYVYIFLCVCMYVHVYRHYRYVYIKYVYIHSNIQCVSKLFSYTY
jgi:hypothetical protein